MMQDAFCPWCGEVFRVRTHSKACEQQRMPLDPKLLEAIELIGGAYVQWFLAGRPRAQNEQPPGTSNTPVEGDPWPTDDHTKGN